jgi:hypothetical protein
MSASGDVAFTIDMYSNDSERRIQGHWLYRRPWFTNASATDWTNVPENNHWHYDWQSQRH